MRLQALVAGLAIAMLGALPASAHTTQYSTALFGSNENPVNASPGVGVALVTLDTDLATLQVQVGFTGLLGDVTASHIHCCTSAPMNVGVATPVPTFPGFPAGATFGFYDRVFDLTQSASYNPAFVTNNGGTVSGAMNALIAGLDAGQAYLNVHTTMFPGGEIRGFLQPVPEPGTYAMMLAGLTLVGWVAARRRQPPR